MVSYYLVEYAYLRHALYVLSLIPPTVAYAPQSAATYTRAPPGLTPSPHSSTH